MSPTRTRAHAPAPVVLLSLILLLAGGWLAGCGVSDDEPSGQSTASATPEPTESESPTEPASASPSDTTSATATTAPSPSLSPEAALLTAAEMPPLNDSSPWRLRDTGPISSRPFGLCARFDVLSIGAEQAVERRFTLRGSPSDSAAQEIATFPDTATVARATKVLRAWHRTCARRLAGLDTNVRSIQSVPVPQGTGWWYLVSYTTSDPGRGGADQGNFHTFGVAVVGTRVSMMRMDHAGQDHNYEPGQDPMQLAVKAAAGKLG